MHKFIPKVNKKPADTGDYCAWVSVKHEINRHRLFLLTTQYFPRERLRRGKNHPQQAGRNTENAKSLSLMTCQ